MTPATLEAPAPVAAGVTAETLTVRLDDGRTIMVPLAWFPRLAYATPHECACYELSEDGVHWPELDEDISVEGLLAGHRSAESAASLAAWRERLGHRRAALARGEEPEPWVPPLPLPDWWEAEA